MMVKWLYQDFEPMVVWDETSDGYYCPVAFLIDLS